MQQEHEPEPLEPGQISTPEPAGSSAALSKRRLLFVVSLVIAAAGGGFLLLNRPIEKDQSAPEKVLTLTDLDNSATHLNSDTSNASVQNLTKELKAKIDQQIADKQNPIETIRTLIGVLCNATTEGRETQCIDFIHDVLINKMGYLKLPSSKYGSPDDLRLTNWRAEFYSNLVTSYGTIRDQQVDGADGKPIDAVTQQLKYIGLYLDIAQNPANWGEPQTADDGHVWYYYEYPDTDGFVALRASLTAAKSGDGGAR